MLGLEEMLLRLLVAIILGAIVGFERELVGKEAGVRTDMLVGAGAALFTMAGIAVHYVIGMPENGANYMDEVMSASRGIAIMAGVVSGIGFLGAGLIIQHGLKVRGLTTAASVWFVAAVGMLAGLGLIQFAAISTVALVGLLYILRKMDLFNLINKEERRKKFIKDDVS